MTVSEFEYAQTLKFEEQEYVEAHADLLRFIRPFRLVVGCIVAIAILFWQYTMIISICYFSLLLLAVWLPRSPVPRYMGSVFENNRFIRQETVYSADPSGFTMTTKGFRARISWNNAVFWQLSRSWLVIQTRGFPNTWFRVSDLKKAGVYESLMATLREHGVKRR